MADPILTHVIAQMQGNVDFLVAQGYITSVDASSIMAKLPSDASSGGMARGRVGAVHPPPDRAIVQARALWGYNESGDDKNDLSFSEGDVIEIVAETNADWWTGKFNGREGLFPSNHVEKLAATNTPTAAAPAVSARPYRPFGAVYHGSDAPPPATVGAVNSVGLQEAPGQEQKKKKFGKLGNQMASSAAGGVGFGAGAAIGGGLVRAIF